MIKLKNKTKILINLLKANSFYFAFKFSRVDLKLYKFITNKNYFSL